LVGTWHDPDLGRPIAAPLERCAELLGVDLATVCETAANVEPYIRADGTKVWSLMQLDGSSGPRCTAGGGAATSTADEPRPPTPECCPRRSMIFGTRACIARSYAPSCLAWRQGGLRFL
jgi:hypothetical protein